MSTKQHNSGRPGSRKSGNIPLFLEFQYHRSEHVVSQHDVLATQSQREKKHFKPPRRAQHVTKISKAEYILAK
ncbi:hypothetical protein EON63_15615 [archaeon]|nr:MAG: hypothetical protein EON63_15615 [archaeon]